MLVGGWPTPLKNMSSSVGIMIPNIWTNKTCSKPPTSENPPRSWWAFHSSPIVCVKSQMHAPYGQTAWDLHRAQRHGFAHPARAERRKRSVSGGPQDDPYQLWDLVSTMIGGIPTPLKNVFSSSDWIIIPTGENQKNHVPKHQPDIVDSWFRLSISVINPAISCWSRPPISQAADVGICCHGLAVRPPGMGDMSLKMVGFMQVSWGFMGFYWDGSVSKPYTPGGHQNLAGLTWMWITH